MFFQRYRLYYWYWVLTVITLVFWLVKLCTILGSLVIVAFSASLNKSWPVSFFLVVVSTLLALTQYQIVCGSHIVFLEIVLARSVLTWLLSLLGWLYSIYISCISLGFCASRLAFVATSVYGDVISLTCRLIFSSWVASIKTCVRFPPLCIGFCISALLLAVWVTFSRKRSSWVSPTRNLSLFPCSVVAHCLSRVLSQL